MFLLVISFFFFKQKTAYEMRISDWSSDVCSSDLIGVADHARADAADVEAAQVGFAELEAVGQADLVAGRRRAAAKRVDIAALAIDIEGEFAGELEMLARGRDRKSTRLNSSH